MIIDSKTCLKLFYADIDLTDESFLNDPEKLKTTINKIRDKNFLPEYKKNTDYFLNIIKDTINNHMFIYDVFNYLKIDFDTIYNYEELFEYYAEIDQHVPDAIIPVNKFESIYLKYLDSFINKEKYGIVSSFIKSNPNYLNISFDNDNFHGVFYTIFGKYFIDLSDDNNYSMLITYSHEMQHLINKIQYNDSHNIEFDELPSLLEELYFNDYLQEIYTYDIVLKKQYNLILEMLNVIFESMDCFIAYSKILNKNFEIDCNSVGNLERLIKKYGQEQLGVLLEKCIHQVIQSFNSIVALDIYFNNRNKDDGFVIAKQCLKSSFYKNFNYSKIEDIFNNAFIELEILNNEINKKNKKYNTRIKSIPNDFT